MPLPRTNPILVRTPSVAKTSQARFEVAGPRTKPMPRGAVSAKRTQARFGTRPFRFDRRPGGGAFPRTKPTPGGSASTETLRKELAMELPGRSFDILDQFPDLFEQPL